MKVRARANPRGLVKKCALCGIETTEFMRAHIPRGTKTTHYIHATCETLINHKVSLYKQEQMDIHQLREYLKTELEPNPVKKGPVGTNDEKMATVKKVTEIKEEIANLKERIRTLKWVIGENDD